MDTYTLPLTQTHTHSCPRANIQINDNVLLHTNKLVMTSWNSNNKQHGRMSTLKVRVCNAIILQYDTTQ